MRFSSFGRLSRGDLLRFAVALLIVSGLWLDRGAIHSQGFHLSSAKQGDWGLAVDDIRSTAKLHDSS